MQIEVEVISSEIVKPSSPTPPHLKTFTLSFLDQISPFLYTPIALHYPASRNGDVNCINETICELKNSLSETLVHFYPLAGRIKDDLSVDCNDEGVEFNQARVNCSMSKILEHPANDLLSLVVPDKQFCSQSKSLAAQVAIQVNIFTCKSIAIGVSSLHKIADGGTMSAFFSTWASKASRSCKKLVCPHFVASSLFPPTTNVPSRTVTSMFKKGKPVVRRFVFNAEAIAKLKAVATRASLTNPSRVQVVSSFIWKYCMAASSRVFGSPRPSIMRQGINLRPRMVPPLPSNSIGNLYLTVATNPAYSERELNGLVALMRDAIGKINGDYLDTLKGSEGFRMLCESFQDIENMDVYNFTSLCNMAFKRLDFGWGRPLWVAPVFSNSRSKASSFQNLCYLFDTIKGDGIEALLMLEDKEMAILEVDDEFLEFASPNPSVV